MASVAPSSASKPSRDEAMSQPLAFQRLKELQEVMGETTTLTVAQRAAVLESPFKADAKTKGGRVAAQAAVLESPFKMPKLPAGATSSSKPAHNTPSKHLSFAQTGPWESKSLNPNSRAFEPPARVPFGELQGNALVDTWRTGSPCTPHKSVLQKWPYAEADLTPPADLSPKRPASRPADAQAPCEPCEPCEEQEARSVAVADGIAMGVEAAVAIVVGAAADQVVAAVMVTLAKAMVSDEAVVTDGAGEAGEAAKEEEEEAEEKEDKFSLLVGMTARTPEKTDVWSEVLQGVSSIQQMLSDDKDDELPEDRQDLVWGVGLPAEEEEAGGKAGKLLDAFDDAAMEDEGEAAMEDEGEAPREAEQDSEAGPPTLDAATLAFLATFVASVMEDVVSDVAEYYRQAEEACIEVENVSITVEAPLEQSANDGHACCSVECEGSTKEEVEVDVDQRVTLNFAPSSEAHKETEQKNEEDMEEARKGTEATPSPARNTDNASASTPPTRAIPPPPSKAPSPAKEEPHVSVSSHVAPSPPDDAAMRSLVASLRGEMRGEHEDLQGRYAKLEAELLQTKSAMQSSASQTQKQMSDITEMLRKSEQRAQIAQERKAQKSCAGAGGCVIS